MYSLIIAVGKAGEHIANRLASAVRTRKQRLSNQLYPYLRILVITNTEKDDTDYIRYFNVAHSRARFEQLAQELESRTSPERIPFGNYEQIGDSRYTSLRSYWRLAFADQLLPFWNRINGIRDGILKPQQQRNLSNYGTNVSAESYRQIRYYIVGSHSEALYNGIAVDLPYWVKHNEATRSPNSVVNITTVSILPDIKDFEVDGQFDHSAYNLTLASTFATLRENDAYLQGLEYSFPYATGAKVETSHPVGQQTYLVGGRNASNMVLNRDDTYTLVSEFVYQKTIHNLDQYMPLPNHLTTNKFRKGSYNSFGISVLSIPTEHLNTYMTYRLARDIMSKYYLNLEKVYRADIVMSNFDEFRQQSRTERFFNLRTAFRDASRQAAYEFITRHINPQPDQFVRSTRSFEQATQRLERQIAERYTNQRINNFYAMEKDFLVKQQNLEDEFEEMINSYASSFLQNPNNDSDRFDGIRAVKQLLIRYAQFIRDNYIPKTQKDLKRAQDSNKKTSQDIPSIRKQYISAFADYYFWSFPKGLLLISIATLMISAYLALFLFDVFYSPLLSAIFFVVVLFALIVWYGISRRQISIMINSLLNIYGIRFDYFNQEFWFQRQSETNQQNLDVLNNKIAAIEHLEDRLNTAFDNISNTYNQLHTDRYINLLLNPEIDKLETSILQEQDLEEIYDKITLGRWGNIISALGEDILIQWFRDTTVDAKDIETYITDICTNITLEEVLRQNINEFLRKLPIEMLNRVMEQRKAMATPYWQLESIQLLEHPTSKLEAIIPSELPIILDQLRILRIPYHYHNEQPHQLVFIGLNESAPFWGVKSVAGEAHSIYNMIREMGQKFLFHTTHERQGTPYPIPRDNDPLDESVLILCPYTRIKFDVTLAIALARLDVKENDIFPIIRRYSQQPQGLSFPYFDEHTNSEKYILLGADADECRGMLYELDNQYLKSLGQQLNDTLLSHPHYANNPSPVETLIRDINTYLDESPNNILLWERNQLIAYRKRLQDESFNLDRF